MHQIDDTDYRELLRRYYTKKKIQSSKYSYRTMGRQLDVDSSQLFRIIRGEQHLPTRCIPMAKKLLSESGISDKYFELLFATSRIYSSSQRQEILHTANIISDIECHQIEPSELSFLDNWWIPVVRSFLEVSEGRAIPEEIATRISPEITRDQAQEALEVLKTLHMIKRLSSGRLGLAQTHLSVGGSEKSDAVRAYQKQVLTLGLASLDSFSVDERDVSTLTLAVDAECFQDLRDMAKEFRRQVKIRVDRATHPDRVLQWSMALHPVVPANKL